jgi:hypothetical protein
MILLISVMLVSLGNILLNLMNLNKAKKRDGGDYVDGGLKR